MDDKLTLLIWPDYISPETLADFERESGVRVELEVIPSSAELVARMKKKGQPPDVLTPPDYAVRQLASEGRLATLEHALLPNLKNVEQRFFESRPHDPGSRVSVIKDWGTTGFMYRVDKLPEVPKSWADFWRLAQKHSGHTSVLDSPGEVIGAALKMRGFSYNASSADQLAIARRDLLELKPHICCFETYYRPLLVSGDVWLSLGWNGDATALKSDGVPVWYVVPSEGSQVWEDDWAIARGARNPEAAHAFIDFLLRPDVAAREALYTRYATGNRAARDLLDPAIRDDPATYPPPELVKKLEPGMPLSPAGQKRRRALWREIRGS